METLKNKFELNEDDNQWVYFPFIISNQQFLEIDWSVFTPSFNKILKNKDDIQRKSISAIVSYAKNINFFTKEEFADLEFEIFDIKLNLSDSEISNFTVSYGAEENERSKIPWKDVYGIWKVYFEDYKIVNTIRE